LDSNSKADLQGALQRVLSERFRAIQGVEAEEDAEENSGIEDDPDHDQDEWTD